MHIEGAWKNIVPVCGNHQDRQVEMAIVQGPHSMFYACPEYYPQNRKAGCACNNRLNLVDYEKMVSHVSGIIAEEAMRGNEIDLTNYSWSRKGTDYTVIKHSGDGIRIAILNRSAMKK